MLRAGYMSLDTVVLLVMVIMWAWTWGTLVRVRRAYTDGLQERARYLEQEREAQARIAAARERARIARELHDIIAHSLGVMVVVADGASRTVHTGPERAGDDGRPRGRHGRGARPPRHPGPSTGTSARASVRCGVHGARSRDQ